MKALVMGCIAIVMLCAFAVGAFGEVPRILTLQGKLTDSLGQPVLDGVQSVTFRLYDVETCATGTALWQEVQNVQTSGGIFNVNLGAVTPIGLPFDEQYWLGMQPPSCSELCPRTRLTTAPYAVRAEIAETAETVWDGAITTEKIADGAVTAAKIGVGAVGTSQLANAAVTSEKMADGAVGTSQIATGVALTGPVIGSFYRDAGKTQLMTVPDTASDTLVTLGATQTLMNKTLDGPQIDMGKNQLRGHNYDIADNGIYSFTSFGSTGWGLIMGRSSAYPIYVQFSFSPSYSPFIQFMINSGAFAALQNTAITSYTQCADNYITLSCTNNVFYVCNRYGRTVSLAFNFFGD
jgi:hypothetical protein